MMIYQIIRFYEIMRFKDVSMYKMMMFMKDAKCESLFLIQMTMGVDSPLMDPLWSNMLR